MLCGHWYSRLRTNLMNGKLCLQRKKEKLFYQIPMLHDLTRRIAELTKELKKLENEKEMLLRSLDCADDVGISDIKKLPHWRVRCRSCPSRKQNILPSLMKP